jgi:sodium-coupled monocarboxylate transporter 8/12
MDPDPFVRSSVWTVSVGMTWMWLANVGVTQECVQRFISMPTFAEAKRFCFHPHHTAVFFENA